MGSARKTNRTTRLFEVVVTYDPQERGHYQYTVDVPALPGCFSEGKTRHEAIRNAREAITLLLAVRENRRKRKDTELVEVPAKDGAVLRQSGRPRGEASGGGVAV